MYKVSLYHYQTPDICIDIDASFLADGSLTVEGYDIGKTVSDAWGDSDYEYSLTIYPDEVKKLYPLFDIKKDDRWGLLNAIKGRFHDNYCFSKFSDFLIQNNINASGFSWT